MRDPKSAPQGVDYIMAVQCAGLAKAQDSFWPYGIRTDLSIAYSNWAYQLVSGDKHDWATVSRDIEASRKDFLAAAGDGTRNERTGRLSAAYGSDAEVCRALADLPEYVWVGG